MSKLFGAILFLFSCSHTGPPKSPHLSVGQLSIFQHTNIVRKISGGTGFAISPHEIMTANHICEILDRKDISILFSFYDGKKIEIINKDLSLVARDPEVDLCILSLRNHSLKWIKFAEEEPHIGDVIYTYGIPNTTEFILTSGFYGYNTELTYNLTPIESKTIPAAILSLPSFYGNSGGPVLNNKGEYIGVVIAAYAHYSHMSYTPTYQDIKSFLKRCNK